MPRPPLAGANVRLPLPATGRASLNLDHASVGVLALEEGEAWLEERLKDAHSVGIHSVVKPTDEGRLFDQEPDMKTGRPLRGFGVRGEGEGEAHLVADDEGIGLPLGRSGIKPEVALARPTPLPELPGPAEASAKPRSRRPSQSGSTTVCAVAIAV
jgi:hypothetical protein